MSVDDPRPYRTQTDLEERFCCTLCLFLVFQSSLLEARSPLGHAHAAGLLSQVPLFRSTPRAPARARRGRRARIADYAGPGRASAVSAPPKLQFRWTTYGSRSESAPRRFGSASRGRDALVSWRGREHAVEGQATHLLHHLGKRGPQRLAVPKQRRGGVYFDQRRRPVARQHEIQTEHLERRARGRAR